MRNLFLFLTLFALAQTTLGQSVIKGRVTDTNQQPLAGASVEIRELKVGTYTDTNGQFVFRQIENQQKLTLRISFLGYKPYQTTVETTANADLKIVMEEQIITTQEITVSTSRADAETPVSQTTISKTTIEEWNSGQDIPYILQLTPSIIATSDAGAGVGYTTFRIRGSDQTRINATINDMPLNNPESHQIYWVNIPDLAESTGSIQIQRGVGTSTNGAAAFGGSLNIQTNQVETKPYAEISNAAGSFNTFKHTAKAGTGILENNFYFDARISKIKTDGFIDRSFSDLESFAVSGGYVSNKHIIRANIMSGKETTYQAWEGVPKVRIENNTEGMLQFAEESGYSDEETQNLLNSGSRTFNRFMYNNQTDNYWQDIYQLFYTYKHNELFSANAALFGVAGEGYYESYKYGEDFEDYKLPDAVSGTDTITDTDLINRKWLDNKFYGFITSATYNSENLKITLGAGANRYDGYHFGRVIWTKYSGGQIPIDHEYYRNKGVKDDANAYLKANYKIFNYLNIYGDLQMRFIEHSIDGDDDDNRDVTQKHSFLFFNPKFGVMYQKEKVSAYASIAQSNREPDRSNFTDADPAKPAPKSERLFDLEVGANYNSSKFAAGLNYYYMHYKDQLVLTGMINDTGGAVMENVKQSYRTGVELMAAYKPLNWLELSANATLSQNKITGFVSYMDNWDNWETGEQSIDTIGTTDIAFSPNVLAGTMITVKPVENLSVSLMNNYVGKQYIDNTSSNDRALDAYLVANLRINYVWEVFKVKANIFAQVNNIYNTKYSSNAWVYTYRFNQEIHTMDGYFTQAGINFMIGLTLRF